MVRIYLHLRKKGRQITDAKLGLLDGLGATTKFQLELRIGSENESAL